ncbi:hypothetical protein Y032_0004g2159 [Ancylostoma ceylanicum]|uniref:N-acetyltransferase domain-containing protein n=1 Tax=Ancylostoma ceylanicum TaxID=53326 RepID=A0A016VXF4_9BILA|nr:hypothetical protein Y032_0004g2159 [Ancylostoma ceylanicum]
MDNFQISIATIDHREEIRDFIMKHFLVEETMNVATAITEEEFAPFADASLDSSLLTPFSVLCRSESGDLAGVALSSICHRDDPEFSNPLGSPRRPEIAAIAVLHTNYHGELLKLSAGGYIILSKVTGGLLSISMQAQKRGATICEEIHGSIWRLLDPKINTVLELDILSVALPYQRRGIAGKMLEKRKSPELLKEFEVQGFICQASSFANQMLLRKRGHKV